MARMSEKDKAVVQEQHKQMRDKEMKKKQKKKPELPKRYRKGKD